MNAYRETDAHQWAKAAVFAGCVRAGYEATAEAVGEGWRADVLAARGSVRIAFEVQWSFLKLRDARARQQRYARDGVRGCWYFRQPPNMLEREDTLVAQQDLPLFHLFANADGSFVIRLCGRLTPLDAFTESLLRGKIRFCDEVSVAESGEAALGFYPLTCGGCGRTAHVFKLESGLTARCGHAPTRTREMESTALRGEFLTLARSLAASAPELHLARYEFGESERRVICPHCGVEIAERRVEMASYGVQPYRRLTGGFALRRPLTLHAAHWCFPPDGTAHCCEI